MLEVATRPHEVEGLAEWAELHRAYGHQVELLDAAQAQALLHSPRLLGAVRRPGSGGVLDPAKLVRELARVARQRGVAVYEGTPVTGVAETGSPTHGLVVRTPQGSVSARRVVLATNAHTAGLLPSAATALRARLRLRPGLGRADPAAAAGDRLGRARGRVRLGQPVPLLPAHAPTTGSCGAVTTRSTAGAARSAPEHDVDRATHEVLERNFAAMFPALADLRVPVPLGWRHRDHLAVHRDVRQPLRRATGLRPRLHRARASARAASAGTVLADLLQVPGQRPAQAADGAQGAVPVPAGAAALRQPSR